MRRKRFRHEREEPALPQRSPVEDAVPVFRDPPARHLFQDDAASQRLFNRAALEAMGDYGAVILASDSLRPSWSEPGDLVHVRRGAEDARAIARKLKDKSGDGDGE
ncbi:MULTISPECIES: hypothetical protein [Hyphobacterium]|uniref:Uncharacterized protein n=1 Tax=Hyphobacterium vulgare TaxID=1736751 RepID=A0ABV6ZWI5_9PROT